MKIDIPKILLELRREVGQAKIEKGESRMERLAFRVWAFLMRRPRLYELLAMAAPAAMPDSGNGWIKSFPLAFGPVARWLAHRDLPAPAARSFRQLWRERQGRRRGVG